MFCLVGKVTYPGVNTMCAALLSRRKTLAVSLLTAAAALLAAGCTPTLPGPAADGEYDVDGATMMLPTGSDQLMVITEHEGIGSTTIYGSFPESGDEPMITSLSADVGDDTLTVDFDNAGRPTLIRLGPTSLSLDYRDDATVDFRVDEDGVTLFEGTGLNFETEIGKVIAARWNPVTEIDLFDCVEEEMNYWAGRTIGRNQPGTTVSVADHPFTDCLLNSNALWNLAASSCVMVQTLQRRMNAIMARPPSEDRQDSINFILVSVLGVMPGATRMIDSSAFAIADQLWEDPMCRSGQDRPGCSDTCAYAFDGVCDDGGPGSTYSVCELGTDCGDCGPRDSGGGGTDDEEDEAVCGDGICDAEAGELTSCPEDCPVTCGDGICNISGGEQQSCPEDCPEVQCCIDTGGCPTETLYECPGNCCCCPWGARCTQVDGRWVCGV